MQIDELLKQLLDKGASDLHLKVPSRPVLRINGVLEPLEDFPPVETKDIETVFGQITNQEQKVAFDNDMELDFAYGVPGLARFRVNVLKQRGTLSLAFRYVPVDIPTIDELELPQICKELVCKPKGLILVTGPAGCGKSTTLAAMLNYLNETERRNVITVEDPIEFLFRDSKCIIRQRDLGDDTKSFSTALIQALRHDADVIVVGEMRDLDTISTAIRAAQTGHLVLGTLHTGDATQSIDRIIDIFPTGQQRQIRLQLAQVIEGVLSQTLVNRINGGRVAAVEVMITTGVVKSQIREEKTYEIPRSMEIGRREGAQTLDQALADLVKNGTVSLDEALSKCDSHAKLKALIENEGIY